MYIYAYMHSCWYHHPHHTAYIIIHHHPSSISIHNHTSSCCFVRTRVSNANPRQPIVAKSMMIRGRIEKLAGTNQYATCTEHHPVTAKTLRKSAALELYVTRNARYQKLQCLTMEQQGQNSDKAQEEKAR